MTYEEAKDIWVVMNKWRNRTLDEAAAIARAGIDPEFIAQQIEAMKK